MIVWNTLHNKNTYHLRLKGCRNVLNLNAAPKMKLAKYKSKTKYLRNETNYNTIMKDLNNSGELQPIFFFKIGCLVLFLSNIIKCNENIIFSSILKAYLTSSKHNWWRFLVERKHVFSRTHHTAGGARNYYHENGHQCNAGVFKLFSWRPKCQHQNLDATHNRKKC